MRGHTTDMYRIAEANYLSPTRLPASVLSSIMHEFCLLYREHQALEQAKAIAIPTTKETT